MNALPIAAFTSLLLATTAFAQKSTVAGYALGPNGEPLKNAEIRIQHENKKTPPVAVKSNAQGAYVARDLPVGSYTVTVVGNAAGANSTARIKTKANETTRVDFGARAVAAAPQKKRPARWIYPATGSHMGGFEDAEHKTSGQEEGYGAQPVGRLNPRALERMQNTNQIARPPGS
jgi:hypothetical protein